MQSFTVNAPVRADLSGGTLDIWPLYTLVENETSAMTVNVALNLFASAHFEEAASDEFRLEFILDAEDRFSLVGPIGRTELDQVDERIRFPVFLVSQYLLGRKLPKKIIKLKVETQAPRRSGLGGSSSLAVAITVGMARLFGDYVDQGWQWDLCEWVRDAEAAFLKTPTGTQDYLAALFGGLAAYGAATRSRVRVPFDETTFGALKERMLVLYSGEMHDSGLSNWEVYKRAFESDSQVLSGLSELSQISSKVIATLNSRKIDWSNLGGLFNKEWDIRREMFKVNTPRLDEIVKFLRTQPILGCKVCGAAAGGSLLVLADPAQVPSIKDAATKQNIEVLECLPVETGVGISPSKLIV